MSFYPCEVCEHKCTYKKNLQSYLSTKLSTEPSDCQPTSSAALSIAFSRSMTNVLLQAQRAVSNCIPTPFLAFLPWPRRGMVIYQTLLSLSRACAYILREGAGHQTSLHIVSCPDPTQKMGEGLAHFERFLGCADSAGMKNHSLNQIDFKTSSNIT